MFGHANKILQNAPRNFSVVAAYESLGRLAIAKAELTQTGDPNQAQLALVWCYEFALEAHILYNRAINEAKIGNHFEAWCKLEDAEIRLLHLRPHFQSHWKRFHLNLCEEMIAQWQDIFPYHIFNSPGVHDLEIYCSICRIRLAPSSICNHRPGQIYDGELAVRCVTRYRATHVAAVERPVQRYSVLFSVDDEGQKVDAYNYQNVEYVCSSIPNNYSRWQSEVTIIQEPSTTFRGKSLASCPCGSGTPYSTCCASKPTVPISHRQFTFSFVPPASVPPRIIRTNYQGAFANQRGSKVLHANFFVSRLYTLERDLRIVMADTGVGMGNFSFPRIWHRAKSRTDDI